ncbi:MAG TPA: hypothetical protein VGP88_02015 [Thermoplasmata archaeon]|jgi:hypothetical protein|nr:hypothetical protein [Thermoplasmata archaeon]
MPSARGLLALDPERELARLLPRDHRVRLASSEFQQNLAQLELDLAQFREAWFSDPPRFDDGRQAITDLLASARKIEAAVRELEAICRPVDP